MVKPSDIFGLDLHIEQTGKRLRAGLESALREAIRDRRLRPGTRLPSTRALAQDQGMARNTVSAAYDQLVAEGWLTTRQGAGTYVAELVSLPTTAPSAATEKTDSHIRFDLRPGRPDLSSFPRTTWLRSTRVAMETVIDDSLGYELLRGVPQLRTALAGYLGRARGVVADPNQLVVCAGFTQGLDLICDVLVRRGATTILAEEFGHRSHHSLLSRGALEVLTIPVDYDGAVVHDLPAADAILLTPAHQHPLGGALDPSRRREVTAWAADKGAFIIEDDYDGEFRYDRKAIGALQALAPEQVIYAGTVSKSLAPGVRIGWLVVPQDLLDGILETQTLAGRHAGVVSQIALAHLIESGGYDRHIRRMRGIYRRRRDQLVQILTERVPEARVRGIAAGLHAVVELPPGQTEKKLIARARERGLALAGLSESAAANASAPPALVVGYGTPPSHSYTAALARLAAVLEA